MNQAEIVKDMTVGELHRVLYMNQLLFLLLGIGISLFGFESIGKWASLFKFDWYEIILLGILPAIMLVGIELLLTRVLPAETFDDGGINEKVFKGQSVGKVALISLVVAICEEILFRGVLQVIFGFIITSSFFALMHVRYLRKPLLFIGIVATSFIIGYLFELTNNLIVVIAFHFVVDFLLGLHISRQKS